MPRLILCALLLAPFAKAQEESKQPRLLPPHQAYKDMEEQRADAYHERDQARARAIRKNYPRDYLARWEKSGRKAEGDDLFHLAQFMILADRRHDALGFLLACVGDGKTGDDIRDRARLAYASTAAYCAATTQLEGEGLDEAAETIRGFLKVYSGDENKANRSTLHNNLGRLFDQKGEHDAAIGEWMTAAREAPMIAYVAGRSIAGTLIKQTLDLEQLPALRKRAQAHVTELEILAQKHAAAVKGDPRQEQRVQAVVRRLPDLMRPFSMVGDPAPEWTTIKAYGKGSKIADYKGKVLILDFWATWCPWCIKSFPALRDLLKDYEGKDLALVGVTAPAGRVYEARYDLDDDFKEKAKDFTPVAETLPRGADADEQAAFRAKEQEIIATFIANHEMTWDVVLIDGTEPGPKYALTGWPHAVVIDKQGRVRYFKSGALLRDRPEAVKAFRKVLDRLLAE